MVCNVRLPSRRDGWRSRERGAVGRRAAVRGFHDALDQVVSKDAKRFLGFLVCAAWWALAFSFCRIAYAAPSLEVDGNFAGYEDGEEYKGYVVVDSPDNYQSTLCLIGEYAKLIQITTEQYETLSNPSTGGAFYELSQLWRKIGSNASGTEEYYPQWLALSEDFANGLVTVYGYGRVWAAVATDSLIDQAKDDFNTILDGGDVGGGSGGSSGDVTDDGDYVTLKTTPGYAGDWEGQFKDIRITKSIWQEIQQHAQSIGEEYIFICVGAWGGFGATSCEVIFNDENVLPNKYNGADYYEGISGNYSYMEFERNVTVGDTYYLVDRTYTTGVFNGWFGVRPIWVYWFNGGSDGSGGTTTDPWEPPTPSPDPPRNPTTPTPKDPITPDPPSPPTTPVEPTPPTPPQTPTVGDGGTFTVDIQGILDALDEHCIHIQTCLNSNFSGQNSYLGQLFSTYTDAIVTQIYNGDLSKVAAINDANNTIAQGFNDILDYWDSYVEWLDKKLDFKIPESDPFDDGDLLNWMRKIYVRQGVGDVNTRPVDPAIDYRGFAGWLGVLYDAVELDVSDTSLTALTSSLSGLQHTFPFSLPWDVKQVLQALDVSPVTPSASFPSGTSGVSYSLDLHWMDSAMVSVRAFELLVFIVYVMVHTKDLFGYLMGE